MRKRLLLVSLALSLLLVMLVPGTAVARYKAEPLNCPPQSFHAEASVWVTDPGTSTQYGLTIVTRGERAEGVFMVANGWESMVGATLDVRHNSVIRLDPVTGTFAGKAWAIITVNFAGNSGKLYGTYAADLSGHFAIYGEQLVILDVTDDGAFWVAGRDGRSLVTASGDWLGCLEFDGITLVGSAIVDGQYQTMGR
jgi:hypothetical protein